MRGVGLPYLPRACWSVGGERPGSARAAVVLLGPSWGPSLPSVWPPQPQERVDPAPGRGQRGHRVRVCRAEGREEQSGPAERLGFLFIRSLWPQTQDGSVSRGWAQLHTRCDREWMAWSSDLSQRGAEGGGGAGHPRVGRVPTGSRLHREPGVVPAWALGPRPPAVGQRCVLGTGSAQLTDALELRSSMFRWCN